MPLIPKFTTPQAKMIRTLEGLLVVAFNLAMLITPIVTSSHILSAATAVKYAAIVNTATVVARSLAKGVMAWQAPLMPANTAPLTAEPLLGQTLSVPSGGAQVNINVHQPPAPVHPTPVAATVQLQSPAAVTPTSPVTSVQVPTPDPSPVVVAPNSTLQAPVSA